MKAKLGKIWTDSVAYVMLLVGAGLSILFNVVNTLARRGDLIDWVDWVIAVAAPGLVVGMVEMFVNARWTGQRWYMQTLRWAGTLAIGGVAMRVSWTHGHELLLSRGQSGDVATLFPLSIDLLAIMATALILSGRAVAAVVDKPVDKPVDAPVVSSEPVDTTVDTLDAFPPNPFDAVDIPSAMQDNRTLSVWADKDIPVDMDGTPMDTFGPVDTRDVQWTDPADTPLLDVDIPNALPSWMDGLLDRTGPVDNVQAAPLVPPLPQRNASRLTDAERAEAASLVRVGREAGLYTVTEIRTLLAAWYGVSVKTIQRAEVMS